MSPHAPKHAPTLVRRLALAAATALCAAPVALAGPADATPWPPDNPAPTVRDERRDATTAFTIDREFEKHAPGAKVLAVHSPGPNDVWVATAGRYGGLTLHHRVKSAWKEVALPAGGTTSEVKFAGNEADDLWLSTGDVLFRYDGKRWTRSSISVQPRSIADGIGGGVYYLPSSTNGQVWWTDGTHKAQLPAAPGSWYWAGPVISGGERMLTEWGQFQYAVAYEFVGGRWEPRGALRLAVRHPPTTYSPVFTRGWDITETGVEVHISGSESEPQVWPTLVRGKVTAHCTAGRLTCPPNQGLGPVGSFSDGRVIVSGVKAPEDEWGATGRSGVWVSTKDGSFTELRNAVAGVPTDMSVDLSRSEAWAVIDGRLLVYRPDGVPVKVIRPSIPLPRYESEATPATRRASTR